MRATSLRRAALALVLVAAGRVAVDAQGPAAPPAPDRLDSITISGLRRSTDPVVVGLLDLEPGDRLSLASLARARRRLSELPTGGTPSLDVQTAGHTRALAVHADERRLLPNGLMGWTTVAVRSVVTREVRLDVASPFRQGELFQPAYRWASKRPRVALGVSLPAPGALPGVLRVEGGWERQTYAASSTPQSERLEERRRIGVSLSDWSAGWLRWEGGAFADRFDARDYVSLEGGLGARLAADHVALSTGLSHWRPSASSAAGGAAFTTLALTAAWRSTVDASLTGWTLRAGGRVSSSAAPLAVWPGASSGVGRGILLRAHPLLRDDVVTSEVFGRHLAFANVERVQPLRHTRYGEIGAAVFLDAARAWRRLYTSAPSRLHADLGAGLRLKVQTADSLRLDLGVGLRDGRVRLSAGYVTDWNW